MLVKWKCKVSVNRVLFAFDFETRRREDYRGEKLEQKRSDLHGRVKIDKYAQLKWNLRRERLQGNHQKERVKNIEANWISMHS